MASDPRPAGSSPARGTGVDTSAVTRARAELVAGRAWRARDVLAAHVEQVRDIDALRLLGEVLTGMGDLPAAGAAWFGAGVKGREVDAAIAAWREKSADDFAVMWRSLPGSVRAEPRTAKVEALRDRALAASGSELDGAEPIMAPKPSTADQGEPPPEAKAGEKSGIDAAQVIAWVLAALVVVCAVVGFVEILGWLVPGR